MYISIICEIPTFNRTFSYFRNLLILSWLPTSWWPCNSSGGAFRPKLRTSSIPRRRGSSPISIDRWGLNTETVISFVQYQREPWSLKISALLHIINTRFWLIIYRIAAVLLDWQVAWDDDGWHQGPGGGDQEETWRGASQGGDQGHVSPGKVRPQEHDESCGVILSSVLNVTFMQVRWTMLCRIIMGISDLDI